MRRRRAVRALRWIALAILAVEAVLVFTGLLHVADALLLVLALEGLCAVVAVAMAVTVRVHYRRLVAEGRSRQSALIAALGYVLPRPVVFLLRHELKIFEGLWLLLRGRDRVPDGAVVVRYGVGVRAMLVVCAILSIVEIAVVALFVPWQWLRIAALAFTVYGIVWVLGFLGAIRRRPHYATARELVLRFGHLHEMRVDLAAVRRFRTATHAGIKKTVLVSDTAASLSVFGSTAIVAELVDDAAFEIDGRLTRRLLEVRFDADDPAAAVRALSTSPRAPDGV